MHLPTNGKITGDRERAAKNNIRSLISHKYSRPINARQFHLLPQIHSQRAHAFSEHESKLPGHGPRLLWNMSAKITTMASR